MDESLFSYDGIIITNLFGSYVDIPQWEEFCKKYRKILIFDNAASFMSTYNGMNICNFGDYAFSSFHHTKFLGFGEGGFVVVPKEQYDALNSIINFGFYGAREHKQDSSNFKMSDVAAAFILSHLKNYDINNYTNVQNKILELCFNLNFKPFNYKNGTLYNGFPILHHSVVDEKKFLLYNIVAHKYYKPIKILPNSMYVYNRMCNLPMHSNFTDEQIEYLVKSLKAILY
jgi:dTDP-4-amino-4,6-dideoxygalactose transaminase